MPQLKQKPIEIPLTLTHIKGSKHKREYFCTPFQKPSFSLVLLIPNQESNEEREKKKKKGLLLLPLSVSSACTILHVDLIP